MNYQKIYEAIVSKAQNRNTIEGYFEKHHIVPTSLGGTDDEMNIVKLTSREHFIAHVLLAKIYGGKMITAAYLMSTRGNKSRDYSVLREQHISRIKGNKERGIKISKSLSGKVKTEEHVSNWKISRASNDGWKRTEEQNQKLSVSISGHKNPMYGKTHSAEARKIISEANKQKVVCPHCGKIGGISIMKRWHFANCKNQLVVLTDKPT